jgi:hypothetical protein
MSLAWQRWPFHPHLRSSSYLYFVLDHRLATLANRLTPSYADYLRQFEPGTYEWTEFEREFHEFALLAMTAGRRIMLLYPQVPFRGSYPLQALHDRMRTLAGPHLIAIPPISWIRSAGVLLETAEARWKQAVKSSGSGTLRIQTAEYAFAPGPVELSVQLSGASSSPIAIVELIDSGDNRVVASASLDGGSDDRMRDVTVRLVIPGPGMRRLKIRVTALPGGACALANLEMRANYGFEVLDLTGTLNQFSTHASSFDAHPNERTHAVMADLVHAELASRP